MNPSQSLGRKGRIFGAVFETVRVCAGGPKEWENERD